MHLRTTILLMLLMMMLPLLQANIKTMYIEGTDCTFHYRNHSSSFSFLSCTLQGSTYNNWIKCFGSCCQNMPPDQNYATPSLFILQLCRDYTPKNDITTGFILMLLFISFLGALLIIVLIGLCVKKLRARSRRLHNQLLLRVTEVEWQEQSEFANKIEEITWSKQARPQNILPESDSPCSICLQQHTNAILFCKHEYHVECIGGWLKKSICCPFCRRDNIKGVKVYCKSCRWNYLVCSRTFLSNSPQDIPSECNLCQNKYKEQGSMQELMPPQSTLILKGVHSQKHQEVQIEHEPHIVQQANIEHDFSFVN